jgi:hypothetical protein
MVQRLAGAEPLGLFRFNNTLIKHLIRGLNNDFADLAMDGSVEATWENGEWFIRETSYELAYHSFLRNPDEDPSVIIKKQCAWLRYMAEKFLEGIKNGDRIYIRYGERETDELLIRELLAALSRHAEATLLWVVLANENHPPGSVELLNTRFIRGYLKAFAPDDRVLDVNPVGWFDLLRNAWELHFHGKPDGAVVGARPNLLKRKFGGWHGDASATAEFIWNISSPGPGDDQVMKHTIIIDTKPGNQIFGCFVSEGIEPGEIHVASACLWIPGNANIVSAGMVMHGFATLGRADADLSIRDQWQVIWVSSTIPPDERFICPRLCVEASSGAIVYSCSWQLERGAFPRNILR